MASTTVAVSPYSASASLTTRTSTSNAISALTSTSTPKKTSQHVKQSNANQVTPSPGQFQHPRIAEIVRRRAATTFTEKNVKIISLNAVVLLGTFIARDYIQRVFTILASAISLQKFSPIINNAAIFLAAVRLVLCLNIFLASRPLLPYFDKPDLIEDIPLTPSQRALVGLPPSRGSRNTNTNTKPTPTSSSSSGYATPTRYRHTSPSSVSASTSQSPYQNTNMASTATTSGRRSISAAYSPSSPLSLSSFSPAQSGISQQHRLSGGSQFSPSSPLLHKALDQSGNSLRRSQSMRERRLMKPMADPATPSPNARERTKVQAGLNYKWIYERGLKVKDDGSVEY